MKDIISILIAAVIVIAVWLLSGPGDGREMSRGTLWIAGSEMCAGTLYRTKSLYGNARYDFHCDDGRVMSNLANFEVR